MSKQETWWADLPKVKIGDLWVQDARVWVPDKTPGYQLRELEDITHIVIHHSGDVVHDRGLSARTPTRVKEIYNYHVVTKSWPGIGYHIVIDPWGNILLVGGAETIRYHTSYTNEYTYAICMLGNFNQSIPRIFALLTLRELIINLRAGLPNKLTVTGHRDIADPRDPTDCPGDSWPEWNAFIDTHLVPHLVGGDLVSGLIETWRKATGRQG